MNKNKKMYSKVEENVDEWRGAADLERGDNMQRKSIKGKEENEGQVHSIASCGHQENSGICWTMRKINLYKQA